LPQARSFGTGSKRANKHGGRRRIVIAPVRYKTVDVQGDTDLITMPEQMLPGALAAPALVAYERRHSSIGYINPVEHELRFAIQLKAA